ncbi:hypothetical protein ASE16_00855 [Leifsonia sp. Root227]|jgi:hypothetical protein|uniref:GAP family protein n=1 Tax=unclassified Leifsonia TaxID=2663824 RepID=UPI0006F3DBD4|nr:GAP family protein [Leifsonia sp. Root227]KRC51676.1 hypothetical protein ASE16_00855 [Leifsonia sp. Root227]
MGQLLLSLVPLGFGILLSPLAIMALIAILVSRRARINGVMFALGWAVGIGLVLAISYLVFGALEVHEKSVPPVWVPVVRILLAVILLVSAIWVYRRGKAHIVAMAAARTPADVTRAAPQLPGWLRTVENFTVPRAFVLGLGLFVLNPVDASCAVIAGLDVRLALTAPESIWTLVIFGVVGALPIIVPAVLVLVRGKAVEPLLARVRTWVAGNTHVLNAALLLVIAVLQLQKGLSELLSY